MSAPVQGALDAPTWLARFAAELGVQPPTPEQIDTLLAVAGVAAHASERIAAPLTCWLIGRIGVDVDEGLAVAKQVADEAAGGRPSGAEAAAAG